MRRISAVGAALFLSLTACGGAAPAPSKNARTSRSADAGIQVSPPDARVPSADLAKYWPFAGPVTVTGYVDVVGLSRTTAGDQEMVRRLVTLMVDAKRKDMLLRCAHDVIAHSREIVFGGGPEASLMGLGAMPGGGQMIAASCFDDNSVFAKSAPPPGADHGWTGTDGDGSALLAATVGDVILVGTPATVTAVLASSAVAHPFPSSFVLTGDQYVVLEASSGSEMTGRLALAASDRHLAVDSDITVGSASEADLLAQRINTMTTWPADATEGSPTEAIADSIRRLGKALSVERSGNEVKVRFELVGPPQMQAYDVAIYSNLLAFSLGYLARQGGLEEARTMLPILAQRYADAVDEAAKKSHGGKRLKSYPPVPATIPSGKSVVSTSAEWAAWKPLSIELSDPQSFQYEIVAGKKGTDADVVARAELGGDGVVSTLKIHIAVDPKTHAIVVGDVVDATPNPVTDGK